MRTDPYRNLTPEQRLLMHRFDDISRDRRYSYVTQKAYRAHLIRYMFWIDRNKIGALALYCIVYTHLLGILSSMTPNTSYTAKDEMSSLWKDDQCREVARGQKVPGEGGGGEAERKEGRMAEGQTPQASEDTKTILKAIGIAPELADKSRRRRDCFTARTREECILGFARKVRILPSGCWEWTGARQHFGHGLLKFEGKQKKSHRLVLELQLGRELQSSEFACHHCDHGWCVNPAHLYVGTPATNSHDCVSRGRSSKLKGEQSWSATLTQAHVDQIRAKYKPFHYTVNMLAAEYSVCATSIKNILSRKTWKEA